MHEMIGVVRLLRPSPDFLRAAIRTALEYFFLPESSTELILSTQLFLTEERCFRTGLEAA